MNSLQKYTVKGDQKLLEALKVIDDNKKGFAIVIDDADGVVGVITDGDIRRALISGTSLDVKTSDVCTKNISKLEEKDGVSKAIDVFKDSRIKFLPIVDEQNKLKNIITKSQMHSLLLQDIHADLSYDFDLLDEGIVDTEVFQRQWGFYKTTVLNDFYQAKVISVRPGQQLSLQLHHHREEHWIVVHGTWTVQLDGSTIDVHTGSNVFIPVECKHRLTNTDDKENLIISEIQIGDYLGEDDIVRFEDIYGRA